MWSRKQSVCSAVSGVSKCDDADPLSGLQLYPFAIALRVRVLQIVCGLGGMVVGAVGWLEERQKPLLGLGVPTGAITVLAAAISVYYSRGFGGWVSARSRSTSAWGAPWRALGPSPCAAVPLTLLWTAAVAAHIAMVSFCMRSLMNIGCSSRTCIGVAGAQLSVSIITLAAAVFMLQLDLRYDAALSPPPRQSDMHMCTAVSMVPLTSVAINSGNSGDATEPSSSPQNKEKETPPTITKDKLKSPKKEPPKELKSPQRKEEHHTSQNKETKSPLHKNKDVSPKRIDEVTTPNDSAKEVKSPRHIEKCTKPPESKNELQNLPPEPPT